jgi:hypothetical protein
VLDLLSNVDIISLQFFRLVIKYLCYNNCTIAYMLNRVELNVWFVF